VYDPLLTSVRVCSEDVTQAVVVAGQLAAKVSYTLRFVAWVLKVEGLNAHRADGVDCSSKLLDVYTQARGTSRPLSLWYCSGDRRGIDYLTWLPLFSPRVGNLITMHGGC
jgi:hypothetical protein